MNKNMSYTDVVDYHFPIWTSSELFQQYTQTTTAFIAIQTTPIPMLSKTTIRTQDGDIMIETEARRLWYDGEKQYRF